MIVARLHPQGEGDPGGVAGLLQQLRAQLLVQKAVCRALIDEDLGQPGARLDERAGVVGGPGAAVGAEIAGEGLLAPGHLRRGDDRGEGGDRAEAIGIAQRGGERAVAAHGMAHDRLARHVGGEMGADQRRQLVLDVAAHPVMGRVGRLGRVEIEARAEAEIVGSGRVVGHVRAARAGIGGDEDQPVFGAGGARLALFGDVGLGAGETGEIPDHRQTRAGGVFGHEDGKFHRRAGAVGGVAVDALRAAMALRGGDRFEHQ